MIWKPIGARIGKIRRKRHLSRAQLGKLIGISGQHLGLVERGARGLSVNSIVKICNTTGASADYILFGIFCLGENPDEITMLRELSHEQIQITLDIVMKVAQFVNTRNGNEALIREIASRQITGDSSNYLT